MVDFVNIGEYYSLDYLKSSGLLTSKAVDVLYSYRLAPYTASVKVTRTGLDDVSIAFKVVPASSIIIDNNDYLIDQGKGFYAELVYTVLTAGQVDIVLDPRLITGDFVSFPTAWKASAGSFLVTLGTCTSYADDGETLVLGKRNYQSEVAKTKYIIDPTLTAATFPTRPTILVGTQSTRQDSGGGAISGRLKIKLDKSLIYVFRCKNESGEDAYLYSDINVFEV